jgi:hypothetical protein
MKGVLTMSINPDKLNQLLGKAVVDFGATFHAALVRTTSGCSLRRWFKAFSSGDPDAVQYDI